MELSGHSAGKDMDSTKIWGINMSLSSRFDDKDARSYGHKDIRDMTSY